VWFTCPIGGPKLGSLKTIAIIQARRSSRRLPDKVLLDIGGKPMLQRVVERTRQARRLDEVIVATTIAPEDDAIGQLCQQIGVSVTRGSVFDVLDRFYQAALAWQAEVVVRITADCPLIDPGVIDQVVEAFFNWGRPSPPAPLPGGEGSRPSPLAPLPEGEESRPSPPAPLPGGEGSKARWDFAANRLPPPWKRTFPIGLDVEVCTFAALERAWREATQPYHREHVMPYLYEAERSVHVSTLQSPAHLPPFPPSFFRVLRVDHDPDYGFYRWTVDTAEDLQFVRHVYAHFDNRDSFSWLEVLEYVQRHPEIAQINAAVRHKTVHEIDERQAGTETKPIP
jgi:spore coat polysaccharide biosynthesis protein SpsF